MTRRRMCLAWLAACVLGGCGTAPPDAAPPPWPALETLAVGAPAADAGRAWDGVVEPVQRAVLSAQTAGRIVDVAVDVDDRVQRDAGLLRITAFEQRAGAEAARAQVRAADALAVEADGTFRRYEALARRQSVSRAQLDQVRAARDAAVAARDAARATAAQFEQQAAYTDVRAPFDGVVDARFVEPGETVAPGQPLLAVHAPGALRIEVQVPQSEAAAIRAAARADVVLPGGRRIAAAHVVVRPSAEALTHSVGVRVLLPDMDDPPQPGAAVSVVFPIAPDRAVLRVPASATVQRGEFSGAYVRVDDRIVLRQLRLGRRVGDDVDVLAGLQAGDRLVADPVAAAQALAARREASADD